MLISTSDVNEIFTLLCLADPLYACPAQVLHSQQAEVLLLLVHYQHTLAEAEARQEMGQARNNKQVNAGFCDQYEILMHAKS